MKLNISTYGRNMASSSSLTTNSTVSLAELLRKIASQQRPNLVNLDPHIFPENVGPLPGEVIEITGDSNTGKTMLLTELIARAVMPTKFGGQQTIVMLLEAQVNYQILNLVNIMQRIVHEHCPDCAEPEMLEIIHTSLENVQTLTCYTRDDLDMAIFSLESMFLQNTQISMVALHGINTFYWQDGTDRLPSIGQHIKELLDRLRKVTDSHGAVLAYTRPSYFRSKNSTDLMSDDERGAFDYQFELKLIENPVANDLSNFVAKVRILKMDEEIYRKYTISTFGFQWDPLTESDKSILI